jgi:hypothetical protein
MDLPFGGVTPKNPIHVVSNGSAGVAVARLPKGENNTYCVFTIEEEKLRLRVRELRNNAGMGAQLFDQILPIAPTPADA